MAPGPASVQVTTSTSPETAAVKVIVPSPAVTEAADATTSRLVSSFIPPVPEQAARSTPAARAARRERVEMVAPPPKIAAPAIRGATRSRG